MRFNPKARVDQSQIENRGGGGGGFGGGGMQIPIPSGAGGGGRMGIGTILVMVVFFVLYSCMGGGLPGGSQTTAPAQTNPDSAAGSECVSGEDANNDRSCEIDLFTTSIQNYWKQAYPEQTNQAYRVTQTVKFSGAVNSGCGQASSQMGPFYCPNDLKVYLDESFFTQMLEGQLGAKGGPFAVGYVIAHEYGHHIENQLGILGKARTQQGPTSDAVRVELMADCLAGAWAKNAQTTTDASGEPIISELNDDDIKRAIDAAKTVGDDYIQQRTSGRVNPEGWTHGSSEQRIRWFNQGMKDGTIRGCDTWRTDDL